MSATVTRLPVRFARPKPDSVRFIVDFSRPTLRFYAAEKFHHNVLFETEAEARAEGDRLVREDGLSWLEGGETR